MTESHDDPHGPPPVPCWEAAATPRLELLRSLRAGPLRDDGRMVPADLGQRVAKARHDEVDRPRVLVGVGTCGLGAGAGRTLAAAREHLARRGQGADVVGVGCVGLCCDEPLVEVQLPGRPRLCFGPVGEEQVGELLDTLWAGEVPERWLLGQRRPEHHQRGYERVPLLEEHPFFSGQRRIVLAGCGIVDPLDLDEYIARGGYGALYRAVASLGPERLCELVERSGLRGRGGGGFSTGRKWRLAREQPERERYLICNADEGDPGAFMDRAVAESDPHRLLEGILLAAFAIGADRAYVYIRAEYPLAVEHLSHAIERAREYGLLGDDILGLGAAVDVRIKMGAGAFVCGEETALIHSIEGRRGMPRPRPPYPVVQGLFGKPTVINNVETLANLPWIVDHGGRAFAAIGTEKSKGTKVFALSGQVRRTGLVEVPMGTSLREVVTGAGGGIPNGRRCKAVQIGGPSGGCIPAAELDIPTDYEALKDFGAIMGSGGLVVMDESTCMVDLAKYFMQFVQSESCGKCIPCREGTRRMLEILTSLTHGARDQTGLDSLWRVRGVMQLEQLGEVIRSTSLCGLGQTAPNPVLSTLRWFRDEYEAHLYERRCPAGACKELAPVPCQSGCPVGTEVWRYVAHVARGELEDAYRVIREANPFPSTCARVCHHPCEAVCRAGTTGGEPVAVRALKRYVVDRVDPATFRVAVEPARPDAPRIAIIGAGPAGLTAAHLLSVRGYRVRLLERQPRPGGMLLCGIPAYRLPRELLEREIAALLNDNVELRCGTSLGHEATIDGLFAEGFAAVYVAIGAHGTKRLGIEGEEAAGVWPSIEFLTAHNVRSEPLAHGRVGVVGGGNSAIDAARVARRQPGVEQVTVLYRRTREEMPAYSEEIDAALEEGIELRTLVTPVRIEVADGRACALWMLRNELGAADSSGRRAPVPIADSEHRIELDTIVAAIGEQPNRDALDGLPLTRWGTIRASTESCATGRPGLFAGGDVATGPATVVEAVAAGKRAAVMIDRYLRGQLLRLLPRIALPTAYVPTVELDATDTDPADGLPTTRACPGHLPVAGRQSFAEVDLGLAPAEALREARRCLRCDLEHTQP